MFFRVIIFFILSLLQNIDPDSHSHETNVDCSYYDNASFQTKFCSDMESLRVFHLNLRSTNKNLDELVLYLHSFTIEFHVLVRTATWPRVLEIS